MNIRKRNLRAWATIPAIVVIVAITVIAGPANAATYTTPVPLGAAESFAEPTVALNVGVTAAHIPVAVVTIPRLPSTSTSNEFEPIKPVNFVQGFVLGFVLVLIGALLLLGRAGPLKS